MRNPFKRQPTEIEIPPLDISIKQPLHITHAVNHLIEYAPKPRPVRISFTCVNGSGERWQLNPITITGQTLLPVYVPLSFLTGRKADGGEQVRLDGYIEY